MGGLYGPTGVCGHYEQGGEMTRPRHTRRDKNQLSMVTILRSLGMVVWDLADHGGDVLDLVCFWRGQIRVVEVKRPGFRNALTPNERQSIHALKAVGVEVVVAETWRDVVNAFEEGNDAR